MSLSLRVCGDLVCWIVQEVHASLHFLVSVFLLLRPSMLCSASCHVLGCTELLYSSSAAWHCTAACGSCCKGSLWYTCGIVQVSTEPRPLADGMQHAFWPLKPSWSHPELTRQWLWQV